jgi:hypothetical protein
VARMGKLHYPCSMIREKKVLWKRCGWMEVVNINGIYSLPELLDWCCGFVVVLYSLQHRMVPNPTKLTILVRSKGSETFLFLYKMYKKVVRTLIKKKIKFSSYIRKFRRNRLQSLI